MTAEEQRLERLRRAIDESLTESFDRAMGSLRIALPPKVRGALLAAYASGVVAVTHRALAVATLGGGPAQIADVIERIHKEAYAILTPRPAGETLQ
jgi:hypothetical protein